MYKNAIPIARAAISEIDSVKSSVGGADGLLRTFVCVKSTLAFGKRIDFTIFEPMLSVPLETEVTVLTVTFAIVVLGPAVIFMIPEAPPPGR